MDDIGPLAGFLRTLRRRLGAGLFPGRFAIRPPEAFLGRPLASILCDRPFVYDRPAILAKQSKQIDC